jgi:hypothetical protein
VSPPSPALARADQIIAAHGAGAPQTTLPAEVQGAFTLLAQVAAQRVERYAAFRTWWATHQDLLDRIQALATGDRHPAPAS